MQVNFKATQAPKSTNKFDSLIAMPQAQQAAVAAKPMEPDSVKISETEPAKKKGPITKIKNFIGSIKKFNATLGIYIKSTFKGLFEGVLAGSTVFTAGSIISHFKNKTPKIVADVAENIAQSDVVSEGAKKVTKKLKNSPSKLPKVLGVLTGVGVLVMNYWKASLDSNEAKANIDHRWTKTPTITK